MSRTEYDVTVLGEAGLRMAQTDHRHDIVDVMENPREPIDLTVSFLNGSCIVIAAEPTWMGSQLRQQLDRSLPPGKAIQQLVDGDRPLLDSEALANSGVFQSRQLYAVVGSLEDGDLLSKSYEAVDLRARGYTAERLHEAGYKTKQLYEAGFSTEDQLRAVGYTAQNFDKLQREVASLSQGTRTRYPSSKEEEERQRYREAQEQLQKFFSLVVQLISEQGCSPAELRQAGCSKALLMPGWHFQPWHFRQAGFSVAELMQGTRPSASFFRGAGYPAHQLLDAGYKELELRQARFTEAEIGHTAGPSAQDRRETGCTAQDLRNAGYLEWELHEAGYSKQQILAAGYSANDELQYSPNNYSAAELRAAGYLVQDLWYVWKWQKQIRDAKQELCEAGLVGSQPRDARHSSNQ